MEEENLSKDTNNKKVWAIGGGKGGIGKTLFTANMGVGLAKIGKKVIVVDSDLGGANLHTLLGIKYVKYNLSDYLNNICELDEVIMSTPIEGLKLIGGANGILGAANPYFSQKNKIINCFKTLKADYIILDLGAGSSYNVLDFFNAADKKIAIVCPEPTSIQNVYGFLKTTIYRKLIRIFNHNLKIKELITYAANPKNGKGAGTINELSQWIYEVDKTSYEIFRKTVNEYRPSIIMNMLKNKEEQNVAQGLNLVTKRFLDFEINYLGFLQSDPLVPESVRAMRPFMEMRAESPVSNSLNKIINRLI
ncbi:MAG: AAA family ATPase [Nitrospinae bacterium]|nr:AAA family ATPase [Nitrospinota bacterium]